MDESICCCCEPLGEPAPYFDYEGADIKDLSGLLDAVYTEPVIVEPTLVQQIDVNPIPTEPIFTDPVLVEPIIERVVLEPISIDPSAGEVAEEPTDGSIVIGGGFDLTPANMVVESPDPEPVDVHPATGTIVGGVGPFGEITVVETAADGPTPTNGSVLSTQPYDLANVHTSSLADYDQIPSGGRQALDGGLDPLTQVVIGDLNVRALNRNLLIG